jgi:RND family efflux transporter MFP subunit
MTSEHNIPDAPLGSPIHREGSSAASRRRRGQIILVAVVVIFAIGIYVGIRQRVDAETDLARTTEQAAVPTVNVTHPEQGAPNEEIVLPGNTRAFTEAAIYARTSGYLMRWTSDIGTRVKQGDLLAEIDTPEVNEQLRQSRADLATAQANLKVAELTAQRKEDLMKTRSISIQDRDNAVGLFEANKSIVASKQADVARLTRLQSYQKVYAPFDGIITARNTDTGALVDAGASSAARELFHLSAIDKIRVFVAVPQIYSRAVTPDATAGVTLEEYPGETFHGTLARTSNAIDPISRTLTAEVDVDNPDGKLLPGAYAFVHLSLPSDIRSVTVPSNTLIFRRDGLQIALVKDDKATLTPITIGRDYGDKVEIVSGLQADATIILDPSDSLIDGTPVQIRQAAAVDAAQ